MTEFLLKRPIAVIMSFVALIVFSIIAAFQLPVSLLPGIDIPKIVISIHYPNGSPTEIDQNILRPIRDQMITLKNLEDMESKAGNETGIVELSFGYGTNMGLAYIEVNEKIDRLANSLPKDLARPQVTRINTSDIPIVRIQVVPEDEDTMLEVSELTEKVLKKRIEQLEGVSLVDINGLQIKTINIMPDPSEMQALGISENTLIEAIQDNNRELGAISVKDGQYRYYLKLASKLYGINDVKQIPIAINDGTSITLGKIAEVKEGIEEVQGYHLFNRETALVITVHKQAHAKMTNLVPLLYECIENFRKDYANVQFHITQDQSVLLQAAISSLQTSLLFGGIFSFLVLFIFMGDYRLPVIIGISLPTSLVISFLILYLVDVSLNIISLSGLALGLGMLIDNAIIVIDYISRKRKEGFSLFQSCVRGTEEVRSALISSVLTTLAVFVPLIFLSGLSGALFFDQAISVTIILSVSLVVSFILIPLVYLLIFKAKSNKPIEDSRIFKRVLKFYKITFEYAFKYKRSTLIIISSLIPLGFLTALILDVEAFPYIEKEESLLQIGWNEPISIEENRKRINMLLESFEGRFKLAESDVGLRQFLIQEDDNDIQKASIYFLFEDYRQKEKTTEAIRKELFIAYPFASIKIVDAPNAFDQLFNKDKPYFEARFKNYKKSFPVSDDNANRLVNAFKEEAGLEESDIQFGAGLIEATAVKLTIHKNKLDLYNIDYNFFKDKLKKLYGNYIITDIKSYGDNIPIVLINGRENFERQSTFIKSKTGNVYSLQSFITYEYITDYKYVTADKSGIYQAFMLSNPTIDFDMVIRAFEKIAYNNLLNVKFEGVYFENKKNIKQLLIILSLSIVLLYFILTAQFESFLQPLIVIFTLPLGLSGSLFLLLMTSSSLNIMSLIGLVVILGIMVNDAILRIDTMNMIRKTMVKNLIYDDHAAFFQHKNYILEKAIKSSGEIRLKSILMTSLTTILALLPIIFSSGIGADLQKPLIYCVIGGLTIGTFSALYFVPVLYWLFAINSINKEYKVKDK